MHRAAEVEERQGEAPALGVRRLVLVGLAVSAGLLTAAPAAMPAGYSWVSQTTSESAAQGVPGAWVARLGFALFGVAVLALAGAARAWWGRWSAVLHAVFGVLMVAAAVFSHRPWLAEAPVDELDDLLHSVAASGMGLAFAVGVLLVALRRGSSDPLLRVLDGVAVLASVGIPLAMTLLPDVQGALQRAMFGVAYAWYAVQAVRARV